MRENGFVTVSRHSITGWVERRPKRRTSARRSRLAWQRITTKEAALKAAAAGKDWRSAVRPMSPTTWKSGLPDAFASTARSSRTKTKSSAAAAQSAQRGAMDCTHVTGL